MARSDSLPQINLGVRVRPRGLFTLLYVNREDSSVVRFQLRSRHTSSKVYNIWIRTSISHIPNIEKYCQSKVGARLLGCCVRVASVLWILAP
ncbi:uncharacterized protein TNCV_1215101 [Trichonephila clavipes]|nr:uncharacterized protein TNCV_1215101 [Trichonephila clavipes]